jgi:hypothetical protein
MNGLTVDAPSLLNLDFAKILNSHWSLDGKVSQGVVVLHLSFLSLLSVEERQAYRDPLLLTFDYEVKSSEFLESMSSVLTTISAIAPHESITRKDLHGKLVELDEDFMPDACILKDSQSIRIHLHHLSSHGVRRHSRPVKVLFGGRLSVAYGSSGGRNEPGGGVGRTSGEVGS